MQMTTALSLVAAWCILSTILIVALDYRNVLRRLK